MWEFIKDILTKHTDAETGKTDLDAVMQEIKTESPKHAVPKEQYNKKTEEVEKLTTDLESAQQSNLSTEELQKQLEKAVNDAKERETQFNTDLASMQKTNAVKLALKDSGTVNSDLLFSQVNLDNVIIQDDGKISGLDDQVTTFKESMPYLFQSTETTPPTGKVTIGGNPPASENLSHEQKVAQALGLK